MNRRPTRDYRPAGSRPLPSRRTTRPAPRPARPSHIARRESRGPALALGLVALILVVAAASIVVWQVRRADNAEQAAARAIAAAETAQAAPAATVTPLPTPTRELAASGSVPGGAASAAMPADERAALGDAASLAASTPSAASTADPQRLSTQEATPAQPPAATLAAPSDGAPDGGPDLAALALRLLEFVNVDRAAAGLAPVAWDPIAAQAGQEHSEEMADLGYMSHWNLDGYGPEHRYSFAGGLDFVQENVYRLVHRWADGSGAPIEDWEKVLADAQAALMDSPGHRANILAPEHTHLGVGIAYRADTGTVSIAQEFVNRYVQVEPLPRRARPGDRVILRGTLLPGSADPLVNIAYEPFPAPMTLDALNQTGTYTPAAQHLAVPPVQVGADGRFVSEYTLDAGAAPGLYHILVWVEIAAAAERVPALDAVIEVQP